MLLDRNAVDIGIDFNDKIVEHYQQFWQPFSPIASELRGRATFPMWAGATAKLCHELYCFLLFFVVLVILARHSDFVSPLQCLICPFPWRFLSFLVSLGLGVVVYSFSFVLLPRLEVYTVRRSCMHLNSSSLSYGRCIKHLISRIPNEQVAEETMVARWL